MSPQTYRFLIRLTTSLMISAIFLSINHPTAAQTAPKKRTTRKASDFIKRPEPPKVSVRLMEQATPDNVRVLISLSQQRVYMMVNEEIAIDSPISSGKTAGMTPTGSFSIIEREKDHRSNIYGDFVDSAGRVVRSGVSVKIDSAPSGTHFRGSPMKYFMRLTHDGVGMHIGILPGYPASHGCIRLPSGIAPLIYNKVRAATPVEIRH